MINQKTRAGTPGCPCASSFFSNGASASQREEWSTLGKVALSEAFPLPEAGEDETPTCNDGTGAHGLSPGNYLDDRKFLGRLGCAKPRIV